MYSAREFVYCCGSVPALAEHPPPYLLRLSYPTPRLSYPAPRLSYSILSCPTPRANPTLYPAPRLSYPTARANPTLHPAPRLSCPTPHANPTLFFLPSELVPLWVLVGGIQKKRLRFALELSLRGAAGSFVPWSYLGVLGCPFLHKDRCRGCLGVAVPSQR